MADSKIQGWVKPLVATAPKFVSESVSTKTVENTIDVIKTSNDGNDVPNMDLGDTVLQSVAQIIVNLMTTRKIKGVEDTTNKGLNDILFRSEFYNIPSRLEHRMSLLGSSALAVVYYMDLPNIAVMTVTDYKKIAGIVTYAVAFSDTMDYTDTKQPCYQGLEWRLTKKGRVEVKAVKISPKDYKIIPVKDETYKQEKKKWVKLPKTHTSVPVEVFTNMWDARPDWYAVKNLHSNLNFHSNETKDEWAFSRVQMQQFGVFNSSNTSATLQSAILGGERVHAVSGLASKLREPVEPFYANGSSLVSNQIIVNTLEDKMLKYCWTLRDSIASGTNKHNTEVATFNQVATDTALLKSERFRNNQMTRFFRLHILPLLKEKMDENWKAEYQISEIEQNKIDTGNPNLLNQGNAPKTDDKKEAKKPNEEK